MISKNYERLYGRWLGGEYKNGRWCPKRKVITEESGLRLTVEARVPEIRKNRFTFSHRCTFRGKRVDRVLRVQTLAEARAEAQRRQQLADSGRNPDSDAPADLTVGSVCDAAIAEAEKTLRPRSVANLRYGRSKLAAVANLPVTSLTVDALHEVLDPLQNSVPRKVVVTLSHMYRWLRLNRPEALTALPDMKTVSAIAGRKYQAHHQHAMTCEGNLGEMADGIRHIFAIRKTGELKRLSELFRLFSFLSLLRPAEACAVEYKDFDFEHRIIKIRKTKTLADGFRLPLTEEMAKVYERAIALKRDFENPFLFGHGDSHIASGCFVEWLHDNGFGGQMTAHGVRAMGRVFMFVKGVEDSVAEMCLSHMPKSKVVQAYLRTDMLEQRREPMEEWNTFVCGCLPEGWW